MIAYIELADAHQALLRALGQVTEADRLAKWMCDRLARAGMHALAARLAERVPPASIDFVSCTVHPCWLTDTGEITAAASTILQGQQRFSDDLLAATRRLEPCDARLIDALKRQCEWLVGRLPIGARVDDSVEEMLRLEIAALCRGAGPIHPSIVQTYAMTIALRAWSTAWTAPGAQDPTADDARRAWRAVIVAKVGEALEKDPLQSEIPPAERGVVLRELATVIDRVLGQRDEYLGAFPPGPKTVEMYAKHLGWIFSGRKNDGLSEDYRWYDALLEAEGQKEEPNELLLQTVLQNARIRVAVDLASEATEALYMACAESGPEKDYPEPFPMRYSGFNGGMRRLVWRVGAD